MAHPIYKKSLALHKRFGGKIEVIPKARIKNNNDLSLLYTPGVGAVSALLGKHPERARDYTIKRNAIAVVSDGSAVLGLGNIGPLGALPVMEGKAMLFKSFAGIDAFPIVLNAQDADAIVAAVAAIAPTFGGINIEDIAAPKCFEVEARLKKMLDIPVMHDDQHGTAIVVLAGLINALKVVHRSARAAKVVIVGAGAAGSATAKLLHLYGMNNILICDRTGIVAPGRRNLDPYKRALAKLVNPHNVSGNLQKALAGSDVVIGVSGPAILKRQDIALMNKRAIVFAMANPVPEIIPDEARAGGAAVVATGRSDFPNQINNALVFPGVFRGALDHRVRYITDAMKLKAAVAIAKLVAKPTADRIIPSIFDPRLVSAIAKEIR